MGPTPRGAHQASGIKGEFVGWELAGRQEDEIGGVAAMHAGYCVREKDSKTGFLTNFVIGEKYTLHLRHYLEGIKILVIFSHIFLLYSYFSEYVTAQYQDQMESLLY